MQAHNLHACMHASVRMVFQVCLRVYACHLMTAFIGCECVEFGVGAGVGGEVGGGERDLQLIG